MLLLKIRHVQIVAPPEPVHRPRRAVPPADAETNRFTASMKISFVYPNFLPPPRALGSSVGKRPTYLIS